MPEPKTSKSKTKKSNSPPSVTIREIEACGPCPDQYLPFLADIKSNPVNGNTEGASYFKHKKFKTPKYGPDDPIPLIDIWTIKRANGDVHMDNFDRVEWLLQNITRLNYLQVEVETAASIILSTAYRAAYEQVLSQPHPTKEAARARKT